MHVSQDQISTKRGNRSCQGKLLMIARDVRPAKDHVQNYASLTSVSNIDPYSVASNNNQRDQQQCTASKDSVENKNIAGHSCQEMNQEEQSNRDGDIAIID